MESHDELNNNSIVNIDTVATAYDENNSSPNATYLRDSSLYLKNDEFFMIMNDVGSSNIDGKRVKMRQKTQKHPS